MGRSWDDQSLNTIRSDRNPGHVGAPRQRGRLNLLWEFRLPCSECSKSGAKGAHTSSSTMGCHYASESLLEASMASVPTLTLPPSLLRHCKQGEIATRRAPVRPEPMWHIHSDCDSKQKSSHGWTRTELRSHTQVVPSSRLLKTVLNTRPGPRPARSHRPVIHESHEEAPS